MLSQGAFNALLKTLEEPPGYVVFILATTEPQKKFQLLFYQGVKDMTLKGFPLKRLLIISEIFVLPLKSMQTTRPLI